MRAIVFRIAERAPAGPAWTRRWRICAAYNTDRRRGKRFRSITAPADPKPVTWGSGNRVSIWPQAAAHARLVCDIFHPMWINGMIFALFFSGFQPDVPVRKAAFRPHAPCNHTQTHRKMTRNLPQITTDASRDPAQVLRHPRHISARLRLGTYNEKPRRRTTGDGASDSSVWRLIQRALSPGSEHRHTAVHMQRGASDIACFSAGQIQHG
ncbi:hypothetical protein PhaeoP59_01838 [Phaeobacter inhibens]|nr:hypothetical protein PhaeoP59_01838 [Phaeobacter inhibens]